MKNSNDSIGNRIRDLPVQPNAPLRAPNQYIVSYLLWWTTVMVRSWARSRYLMVIRVRITVNQRFPDLFGQNFWASNIQMKPPKGLESNTYLLTPWSRVLLEGLRGTQLIKKFPACYRTGRFMNLFTSASHLPLSWAKAIQPIPHPFLKYSF